MLVPAPLAPLVRPLPDAIQGATQVVVPTGLRALFLAGLAGPAPLVGLVATEAEAEELFDDLRLFSSVGYLLPAWETFPFEHISPTSLAMARRAEARQALGKPGNIVVASVRAATQRVSPSSMAPLEIAVGDEIDLSDTARELVGLGYVRIDRVEGRGEFAIRGGILDLFAAQAETPVRIELVGDAVESVRGFEVGTQRSSTEVPGVFAYPARELRPQASVIDAARARAVTDTWAASTWERFTQGVFFAGMESWLPWLAPAVGALGGARVVVFDPGRCHDRSEELVKEEAELAAVLAPTWGDAPPPTAEHPTLYLELEAALSKAETIQAPALASHPDQLGLEVGGLDAVPGDAASVAAAITRWRGKGVEVVVAMDGAAAANRVTRALAEEGLVLPSREALEKVESAVLPIGIHHGFLSTMLGLAVLGETEIAGRRRSHRRIRGIPGGRRTDYRDLKSGDYVIHHRHGIGQFEGLTTEQMSGVERDYLLISYAGGDRLYVPTDQLAAVRRYTGGEAPRLSRMGGADWESTRGKVRRALAVVAQRVVELHRERARASGHPFAPDSPWQAEFEAGFPFEETPDQITAIAGVKGDMESPRPMDRLIFGDVGFGKTEVAIRAAFKAIEGGRQVAVLVPTTLLAQQHFQTFRDRFAPYPVEVAMLSRFLTSREQREVIARLEVGTCDLVVGTHRLLGEDVSFAKLGLVVVDEEHRFGVNAKDRLKELTTSVDMLTLTATPIPRTLEMALSGLREVSRIRTPPQDRQPVLTYVGPYQEQSVAAAIRRELLREGQVFYVHNRVLSIDNAFERLRTLVPDARFAIAHGQLSEGELEQVMFDFWNREYDVLVATTIIESGLDLPSVNTLIVERAELLGLAQLYQLRGRVGRSHQRAYAYLFHSPEQRLSEEAYRRLAAVGEHTELGSGLELALRDLEIRGAGSILGEVQAGHLEAVGLDLYTELVAEAVDEMRGNRRPEPVASEVRIEVAVNAHLPDDYVTNQSARLEAYRRLAAAETEAEVDDVVAEWLDRYGPLPTQAEELAGVAKLRVEALRIGLTEVIQLRQEVKLSPVALSAAEEVRFSRLAPRGVVRDVVMYVPTGPGPVLAWLTSFLRSMWPA